jgi:O-methyltransferase
MTSIESAGSSFVISSVKSILRRFGIGAVRASTLNDLIAEVTEFRELKGGRGADPFARLAHLDNVIAGLRRDLERKADYQVMMVQNQIRAAMTDLEPEFLGLYEKCKAYTMTPWERMYALYMAVRYLVENDIAGDLVECGVWRGGSMRLAAMTLMALGRTDRRLFLYDTFDGMTKPGREDVDLHGEEAINSWNQNQRNQTKWMYTSIEDVTEAMAATGYPMDKIKFIKGPVEQTIPGTMPGAIAMLRLDTDWHSSTKHEIEHLYPMLTRHGVLIVDDYGHYRGSRKAIDEYFDRVGMRPLLHRTDYACRIAIRSQA